MCCEHLVCANCAGPVSEGRCAVCRAARERLHHHDGPALSPATIAALLAVVALIVVLAQHWPG